MTHKDFVLIAGALAEARNHWLHTMDRSGADAESFRSGLNAAVEELSLALRRTNPRFDRQRFLAAAKGEPLTGRDQVRS